jgi:hypothetical protein
MSRKEGSIEEVLRHLAVPNLRRGRHGPLGLNSCTLIEKICELLAVVLVALIWSGASRSWGMT